MSTSTNDNEESTTAQDPTTSPTQTGCKHNWVDATSVEMGCLWFGEEYGNIGAQEVVELCSELGGYPLEILNEIQMEFVIQAASLVEEGLVSKITDLWTSLTENGNSFLCPVGAGI